MKKFAIATGALLIGVFALTSCNKNQQVVKDLEGTWTVTEETYDGVPADPETYQGTTYTFEACKVKKEDCDGVITYSDPLKGTTVNTDFTYSISDKGEKITFNISYVGVTETTVADIEESSDSKFVFSSTDETGVLIVTTLEK